MKARKIAVVSGYFNPLHLGHLEYFKQAAKLADVLFVIVNNDEQQEQKKGKIIMSCLERLLIINELRIVNQTFVSIDRDLTVCETLKLIKAKYSNDEIIFCNGGDRTKKNIPEQGIKGITFKFGIGGKTKLNSSTNINKLRK